MAADMVVTVDGRFVVWKTSQGGTAFDVRTGAVIPLPVNNGRLFVDPSQPRVYVVPTGDHVSMTTVDQTGIRLITIGQVTGTPASNGRDLFVVRQVGSPPTRWISMIDMATGAEQYQIGIDFEPTGLAVSRDGTRLAIAECCRTMRVFDTTTRTEIASRVMPSGTPEAFNPAYRPIGFDLHRNRLFVGVTWQLRPGSLFTHSRQVLVLDATTLGDLGAGTPKSFFALGPTFPRFVRSPREDIAIETACDFDRVETWETPNTPVMFQSRLLPFGLCFSGTAITSVPTAMSAVAQQVAGRRVTLSWTAVAGANDYVVEAGSSLGSANVGRIQTAGALQFTVDNVPSGTYFVRVRPMNDVGFGAASADQIIIVP